MDFIQHHKQATKQDQFTDLTSFYSLLDVNTVQFLPARRYASAGNSDRNVSVCLSVRHAPVLCQNDES